MLYKVRVYCLELESVKIFVLKPQKHVILLVLHDVCFRKRNFLRGRRQNVSMEANHIRVRPMREVFLFIYIYYIY